MSPSKNRTPVLIAAAAVALLLLLGLVAYLQRSAVPAIQQVEATQVVTAPAPTPASTPVPATATPKPTVTPPTPGDGPAPSSATPADPMAEFRVPRFTGKVLDGKTYQPLANAHITAFMLDEGKFSIEPNYPSILEDIWSNASGDFRFTDRAVGRGEVLAWQATLEGYTSMMLLFPAGEGLGDRLRSTFLLKPAGVVAGFVLDEAGTPVGGAVVGDMIVGKFQRPGTPGENTVPSTHTTTDAQGAFRLVGLETGKKQQLPVKAKGFVDYLSAAVETGREDLVFNLTRADASLVGRVEDWERKGARGVKISLSSVSTRVPLSAPLIRTTSTGSNGAFDFPGLISGEYHLTAELDVPDTLGPGCRVDMDVTLLMNQEKRIEIQLPAPARIEGRFVDTKSGRGVAGVRLYRLIDEVIAREAAYNIDSDADGGFAFTAFVPPDQGGYEVRIPMEWGPGWFPLPNEKQADQVRVEQQVLSFMSIKPGEERIGVQVLLGAAGEVSGVVIEPDGATPAVDVPVFFRGERFFTHVNTDNEGRFAASIPVGLSIRFESSTDKGIGAASLKTAEINAPVRLVLGAYGTLSGDLKDGNGVPVGEVPVAVVREDADRFTDAIRFEEKGMARWDGIWRIDNVAPGSIGLLPELSNTTDYASPTPLRVELINGEEITDLHIVLKTGDYIEGRVVDDATDEPIPDVAIITDRRDVSGHTDDQGRFRLAGIPFDTALDTVTASAKGYGEEVRRNVSIYDKELNFRLRPQVETTVRAVDGGGQPIPSYRLRVLSFRADVPGNRGQVVREVSVNSISGEFALGNLATGNYRAEVSEMTTSGDKGRTGAEDFVVGTGGEPKSTVMVYLTADLMLTGTVVFAGSEAPVAGAEVELFNPPINLIDGPRGPDARGFLTTTNGAGIFSIGPIPSGNYLLRAQHEGSASTMVTAPLAAGSSPVKLTVEAQPQLFGTLTAPDGEPVRRATIFVMNEAGVPSGPSLSGNAGRYEISLPSPGVWQVVFSQDDTPNVITRSVTMAAGERRQLDIDFSARVTLTGRLLVNGGPATGNVAALLRGANGEDVLATPSNAGGTTYKVELSPGTYDLYHILGRITAPTWSQITVASSPALQQQDLSMLTGALEMVVVAPDGTTINGLLTLESRSPQGGSAVVLSGERVDRVSIRFLQLPAGSYRGILSLPGGGASTTSGWTEMSSGSLSVVTLDWPVD